MKSILSQLLLFHLFFFLFLFSSQPHQVVLEYMNFLEKADKVVHSLVIDLISHKSSLEECVVILYHGYHLSLHNTNTI